MDLSKQFSLTDFLAYFFPGLFSIIGIYLLILLTPIQASISIDLTTGIVFLALSYIVGIILSGLSDGVDKLIKHKSATNFILMTDFQAEISQAFADIFGSKKEWTASHFYLCRALVFEKMPTVIQRAERQSSLRQLRRNLLIPICIWIGAGIAWGIWSIIYNSWVWGAGLIVLSLLLGILSLRAIIRRMYNNEEREVREVLTAFLAGYKMGVFNSVKDQ